MNAIDILLIVAGVGYVLVRRVVGDIVQLKSLLVLPLVLSVIGAVQLQDVGHLGVVTVGFLGLGIALSLVIGAVRGLTVHLGERNGELWMRYRAGTVGLWVLNFAVKGALIPVEMAVTGDSASSATHGLLLSVGLGILAESAVVLLRAMHRDGQVVWEKGEDGRSHKPAPAFDKARDRIRATDGTGLRTVVSTVKRDW